MARGLPPPEKISREAEMKFTAWPSVAVTPWNTIVTVTPFNAFLALNVTCPTHFVSSPAVRTCVSLTRPSTSTTHH